MVVESPKWFKFGVAATLALIHINKKGRCARIIEEVVSHQNSAFLVPCTTQNMPGGGEEVGTGT